MLRLADPWVRWLYWIVLALVVTGLALAFTARVDETVSGPALVDSRERTFTAVLPAAVNSELRTGHPLRVEVEGLAERHSVGARTLRVEEADDVELRRAGFDSFPRPALLMTGVLIPDPSNVAQLPPPRVNGRAVVVLRSERALTVFMRGLQGMWEGGDS